MGAMKSKVTELEEEHRVRDQRERAAVARAALIVHYRKGYHAAELQRALMGDKWVEKMREHYGSKLRELGVEP